MAGGGGCLDCEDSAAVLRNRYMGSKERQDADRFVRTLQNPLPKKKVFGPMNLQVSGKPRQATGQPQPMSDDAVGRMEQLPRLGKRRHRKNPAEARLVRDRSPSFHCRLTYMD